MLTQINIKIFLISQKPSTIFWNSESNEDFFEWGENIKISSVLTTQNVNTKILSIKSHTYIFFASGWRGRSGCASLSYPASHMPLGLHRDSAVAAWGSFPKPHAAAAWSWCIALLAHHISIRDNMSQVPQKQLRVRLFWVWKNACPCHYYSF